MKYQHGLKQILHAANVMVGTQIYSKVKIYMHRMLPKALHAEVTANTYVPDFQLERLGRLTGGRDDDHSIFWQVARVLDEEMVTTLVRSGLAPLHALTHGMQHGVLLQVFPKMSKPGN